MAAGDAGEVSKAAGGVAKELFGVGAFGQVMHKGVGGQVGQVADGGKNGVVFVGGHGVDVCATGGPGGLHGLYGAGAGFWQGGEDDFFALVECGLGGADAAFFGPGNGVGGDDLCKVLGQVRVEGGNNVAFGAARVGDEGVGAKVGGHGLQERAGLGDGGGDEDEIGLVQGVRPVLGDSVDHAQGLGLFEGFRAATHADDFLYASVLFKGERKGAANEAHAADEDFFEDHDVCLSFSGRVAGR